MGKDAPEAKLATLHAHDGDTRLRLAIEEAGLATWDTNFFTGESIWSANHYRLFGYPVDPTGRATVEMWSSRLHPEDRERALAEIDRAKRERAPYRSEYRIVRADTGDIVWIEPHGRFFYDPDGRAKRQVARFSTSRRASKPRSAWSAAKRSSISRRGSSASASSSTTTSTTGCTGPICFARSTICRRTNRRSSGRSMPRPIPRTANY